MWALPQINKHYITASTIVTVIHLKLCVVTVLMSTVHVRRNQQGKSDIYHTTQERTYLKMCYFAHLHRCFTFSYAYV